MEREEFQRRCEQVEEEIKDLHRMAHEVYYLMGYEDAKQGRKPNPQRVHHYWKGGKDGKDQQ